MTIEEAKKKLDKAIEFYGDCVKDGDTLEEKCHAEEIVDDAIGDLMLAVLDEAVTGARYVPGSKAAWIVALRTRIQAFGKEPA